MKIFYLLMFISCSVARKYAGYPSPELISKKISIGQSKVDVIRILHSNPSSESEDGKTWYYTRFNGREGALISFIPDSKITTKIDFKNDIVDAISTFESKVQ